MQPIPLILGILNLTADSFSDGGRFQTPDAAEAHARQLLNDGADVIDIGAQSTHPRAADVSLEVEIARLTPIVERLKSAGARVSVDTHKPAVMHAMLALQVEFINDVTGFVAPEARQLAAASTAKLIVMHAVHSLDQNGHPRTARAEALPVPADAIVERIEAFWDERIAALEQAGVARERIILDPGMGIFLGADPQASYVALRNLPRLCRRGFPVCVSTSRKSFLVAPGDRERVPPAERGAATLASELYAVQQGARYIRTHDVRALRAALRVWGELNSTV